MLLAKLYLQYQMRILSNIGCFIMIVTVFAISCDPSESLETILKSDLEYTVEISFVSSLLVGQLQENDEVFILKTGIPQTYERLSFQVDGGSVFLTLSEFDSIYITTTTDELLKVYKPGGLGKNIYNIEEYWTVRETAKNHFEYTYTITDEDIGN